MDCQPGGAPIKKLTKKHVFFFCKFYIKVKYNQIRKKCYILKHSYINALHLYPNIFC